MGALLMGLVAGSNKNSSYSEGYNDGYIEARDKFSKLP